MKRIFDWTEEGVWYPQYLSIFDNEDTVSVVSRGPRASEYEAGPTTEVTLPREVFAALVNKLAFGVLGL